MTISKSKKLTFEEYLNYQDDTDQRYELIDGELVALPPESELNNWIAVHLFLLLATAQIVNPRLIRVHSCEIQVPVLGPKDAANRYLDLVILREEHLALTQKCLTITRDMPPPRLVVEVVLAETGYQEVSVLQGETPIISPELGRLGITAAQILQG